MIEMYLTDGNPRETLDNILGQRLGNYEIKRTENGKPYIDGDPLFFSYSHSGGRGLIAISDAPVGADIEACRGKSGQSVFLRFSERERAEIAGERDFLYHWTAREAYIKLYGLKLAEMWRRIEFFGGKIYVDGQAMPVRIRTYAFWFGVGAVCTEE